MKILKTIKSCYLCIKYPFLYPRNRFTGLHYNNWKITKILEKLFKESIENNIHCTTDIGFKENYTSTTVINNFVYRIVISNNKNFYLFKGNKIVFNKPIKEIVNGKIYGDVYFKNKELVFITDGTIRTFFITIYKSKFKFGLYKLLRFYHDKILQIFHCIPTYTELDFMPEGWRKAFGIKMCDEIKKELKKYKFLHKYRIAQIKEKYGSLRWYDFGAPNNSKIQEIIDKYEVISEKTCIDCGKPAKYRTNGWISPYCENCIKGVIYTYDKIEDDENSRNK